MSKREGRVADLGFGVVQSAYRKLESALGDRGAEVIERLDHSPSYCRRVAESLIALMVRLRLVRQVAILESSGSFVVADNFRVNLNDPAAKIKIGLLELDVNLLCVGVVEEPMEAAIVGEFEPTEEMTLAEILTDLGGADLVEMRFSQIWFLLVSGALSMDHSNIFFVKGRLIDVYWNGKHWSMYTYSVECSLLKDTAYRVFSREVPKLSAFQPISV